LLERHFEEKMHFLPIEANEILRNKAGALDNASGVVTVLSAARQVKDIEGVGVLLTDAEELGLAGAQAWASRRAPTVVLNCDGVDDAGSVTVMQASGSVSAVAEAVRRASQDVGISVRVRAMPIGLLTDSVAFAQHGSRSVTFSRGNWASLARVHSRRDDLSHLDGRGISEVARLMAATARRLASRATDT
jgi:Zn-dependent M28 family amino/carboxypeptidase